MSSSGGPTRRWRRRPLKLHSDATRIGAEHRVAGLAGRGSSGPRRVCGASGTHNGTAGHCPGQADRLNIIAAALAPSVRPRLARPDKNALRILSGTSAGHFDSEYSGMILKIVLKG